MAKRAKSVDGMLAKVKARKRWNCDDGQVTLLIARPVRHAGFFLRGKDEPDGNAQPNGDACHQIAGKVKGPNQCHWAPILVRLRLQDADQIIRNLFHSALSLAEAIPCVDRA
ncbi:hypothetical protein [Mesorhizobium koreense]|jgi:hypothetical protein|uniref:hypothetical protein n=1 Tax=Mesorhizobium koreense TaxID=3074855 RepID=UPI00287BA0A5|nr:hypothetical protein [Mesorhizobium sp. WR6]